jgi:general secretion pathway protein D
MFGGVVSKVVKRCRNDNHASVSLGDATDFGLATRQIDKLIRPLALLLPTIVCAVALVLIAGCVQEEGKPEFVEQAPPVRAATAASVATSAPESLLLRSPRAAVYPGTGRFTNESTSPTTQLPTADDDEVTLNFANTDVREVAREVLGNVLHLTYTIDSRVQGTITFQTGRPLSRNAVLPAMETALRAAGLALLESGSVYRILTLEDAAKASSKATSGERASRPGYETRTIQLRYVGATQMRKTLEPFIGTSSVVQADGARNLLIASGPRDSLDNLAGIVAQLDVDWMEGMSFATFPIRIETARNVAKGLAEIFGTYENGRLAEAVQIIPLERQNTILVISAQPTYLEKIRSWIVRLDVRNDDATMQMFQYRVQNSRARDLADVLTQLLINRGAGRNQLAQTGPATRPALLRGSRSPGDSSGFPSAGGQGGAQSLSGGTTSAGPQSSGLSASGDNRLALASGLLGTGSQAAQPGADAPDSITTTDQIELPPIRIVADEKNNALVILAKPADYRMVESIILKLDVVPVQVQIEATIAEVTLNDNLQYGLQYFLKQGHNVENLTNLASGAVSPVFPGFNYALTTGSQQVIVSALAKVTDVNVVSSPQLLVLDHQTAMLQVGDQVPVPIQQSQSQIVPNAPLVSTIQFRDTGVILQVTPRVSSSGLVALDIDQEVSDVTATTSSTLNAPTFNQRRIISSIVVRDGETIALGGLIRSNVNNTKAGIPLLMDIPYIGSLFSTTTKSKSRTELLVLLSPQVVRDSIDAKAATAEIRDRLQLIVPVMKALHR